MNSASISAVGHIAAALGSVTATLVLLSAVVSLSEPQRSQLIAAAANRQATAQKPALLAAQSKQAQPTRIAEVTTR